MKNKNIVVITLLVLVIAFVGLIYFYKSSEVKKVENITSTVEVGKTPFVRDYSPTFGENKKGIYVVEFIDPECESCAVFNNIMKDFYRHYYTDINLVIRYVANHKNSDFAIKILEASRNQNKFKEVLDVMFEKQSIWAEHNNEKPQLLWDLLREVHELDIEKLKVDSQNPEFDKRINLDRVDSAMLNVRGTPTIFINGKKLEKLSADALENLYISEAYK